jgi:fatty acid desaturase
MQETAPNPRAISWYRTRIDPKDFKMLHPKSDLLGFLQSFGYLGLLTLTGGLSLYSFGHLPVGVTLLLVFTHGTFFSFQINAVHELVHNTVFKTKALNSFFLRIFSFLGWWNFDMFDTSHARHHRYTLHAPDDLEVVLPMKVVLRHTWSYGILNPRSAFNGFKESIRIARGQFRGDWELKLFPPGSAERAAAIRWAYVLLVGHSTIILASLYFHLWLLPILTTFANSYGNWLQGLCNNTQHIGLQDDVPDFRLCCRTMTLNPFLEFLYWHMNYHTEHHMYAAVPCYRLKQLHRLIKHDLPPCPHGLIATWREIEAIQKLQDADPNYQYIAPAPNPRYHQEDASPADSSPVLA